MTDSVINRPGTDFDGASHTYHLAKDGSRLWGISSIAKMGEAEDSFRIGAAWGWRLGYEGAHALATEHRALRPFDVEFRTKEGPKTIRVEGQEGLREALSVRKLTPWGQRDQAADRGNWAHDLLEALATNGSSAKALEDVDDEYRAHGHAILRWFLDYRPQFVATEVQVTSEEHGFAGRYDIRCKIAAFRLLEVAEEWLPEDHWVLKRLRLKATSQDYDPLALCLVDLKTSKRIYPLSHFVQLEGYELAGVEMGFPPTDARLVLNTHPDGTYDVGVGYATAGDFLGYLAGYKAMKGLKALDPEERREQALREAVLAALPGISRDIAEKVGLGQDARSIGRICGKLRKRGAVRQREDKVWELS